MRSLPVLLFDTDTVTHIAVFSVSNRNNVVVVLLSLLFLNSNLIVHGVVDCC